MATRREHQQSASLASLAKAALLAVCCSVSAAAHAERLLEIITLQNRLVFEVIPILQPLLEDGGTLTGTDNKLIVRTSRANMEDIKAALLGIDVRLRQLRISVTQDLAAVATTDQNALSEQIRSGNTALDISSPVTAPGATAAAQSPNTSVEFSTAHTHSLEDSRNLHFVRTMDGQRALIETGQALPYGYETADVTPYGASVSQGTAYVHTASGIYVTPHVQGDRVMLDISPQLESVDPNGSGSIESHRADTTVTGRLGEWIAIGGASTAVGTTEAELLARTRRQGDNTYAVWVKVDEEK